MSLEDKILALVDQRILILVKALTTDPIMRKRMLELWKIGPNTRIVQPSSCPHIMRSGINVGRCCGNGAAKNSQLGYCRQHLPRISVPVTRHATSKALERAQIVLQRLLGPGLVDPKTKLVFNGQKLAIGKEINGQVVALSPEDLDFCARQKIEMIAQAMP